MNITQTFRRKNKYHKPIIVFKQLYRDYFQHTSPKQFESQISLHKSQPTSISRFDKNKSLSKNDVEVMPKVPKTNSTQQLSKYLQKYGDPGTSLLKFTTSAQSTLNKSQSTQNNTFVFKLLERSQLQKIQKEKRSYFKNTYTKSHPIFEKAQNFFKEKSFDDKQNQIPTILPQIFKQNGPNLKKPLQKRLQLEQLKSKFIDRKQLATEKFSKIRCNFLMKKNYKPQLQNFQTLRYKEAHDKNSFQITKERIFPQSTI